MNNTNFPSLKKVIWYVKMGDVQGCLMSFLRNLQESHVQILAMS